MLRLNKKTSKEAYCNHQSKQLDNSTPVSIIQNNHSNYDKLKNLNLNELRTQIIQYHQNNHTSFKQPDTSKPFSFQVQPSPQNQADMSVTRKQNNLNPNMQINKNQYLMSFLVKSFKSSTSSLTNSEITSAGGVRKSPSIFTSLSAPRASIDCYQLSESPSLADLKNTSQQYQYQHQPNTQDGFFKYNEESIGKASSIRLTPTPTPTPSPTIEYTTNTRLSSLGFDKILEECTICKGFAISALNSSRCINIQNHHPYHQHQSFDIFNEIDMNSYYTQMQFNDNETNVNTVLNRNHLNVKNSDMLSGSSRIVVMESKPDYCLKCICFCCYDSLVSSRFIKMLNQKRDSLKKLVDGKLQRAILCAILINTLSMGIEHHDQVIFIKQIFYDLIKL